MSKAVQQSKRQMTIVTKVTATEAQAQIESKTMAEKRGDLHPARTPSPPGF